MFTIQKPHLIINNNYLKTIKKKRILVVAPASPSKGGVPSYINELLSSSLKDHFKLLLFNPLLVKKRIEVTQQSKFSLNEIVASIKVIAIFSNTLRTFNPVLVHIHTSSWWGFYEKSLLLLIAKFIFKKKVILHIHGGGFGTFYKKAMSKRLINWVLDQANKTLIVSRQIKEELGLSQMIPVDNCVRFDSSVLSVDKTFLRKKYGIPEEKIVFLSASLLQKIKGIHETLIAFSAIHKKRDDFYFIIAGEGPEKNNIITFIKENNLTNNVKVLDFITGQKKEDIFLLSDVFILNSTMEGLSVAQVETLSYGLFMITTPVGIASDAERVFNDKNSMLIPTNDTQALEMAILQVLDKKLDINKITRKNFYDFKDRFDVEPVIDKMKHLYDEVLNSD